MIPSLMTALLQGGEQNVIWLLVFIKANMFVLSFRLLSILSGVNCEQSSLPLQAGNVVASVLMF